MQHILKFKDVAAMLGWSPRSWSSKWKGMVARGFPRPLPGTTGQPRWSRAQVEEWIARGGQLSPPAVTGEPDTGRAQSEIERRAEAYANARA